VNLAKMTNIGMAHLRPERAQQKAEITPRLTRVPTSKICR
jgi:hypothetical protein